MECKNVKIVYADGETNKVVRGELTKEDNDFLYILDNGLENRVSKKVVISMKECIGEFENGRKFE